MRGAYARYAEVDASSRVESASPHGLVAILFDELLKTIGTMQAAERVCDRARSLTAQGRALTLLNGLESGLDFERGGDIAPTLATIYREARRLLNQRGLERVPAINQAHKIITDIADAWKAIG